MTLTDEAKALLGKQVKATLDSNGKLVVKGRLLSFSQMVIFVIVGHY